MQVHAGVGHADDLESCRRFLEAGAAPAALACAKLRPRSGTVVITRTDGGVIGA